MKKTNFKKQLLILLALLTGFAAFVNAQQTTSNGNSHMLWQVSLQGELQGYLVGSVHLMKPEIYPLDSVFQEAFKKSDVLVFELNFDSLKVKSVGLVRQLAIYPPGKNLKGALSPETYTLLKNTLDSLGLPVARFNRMEPWMISLTVPSIQMRQAGYSGDSGIDMHFFKKAKKEGKKIGALETAAYQLGLFDDLSPQLQEEYLVYSLKDVDETLRTFGEMVTAWQRGNIQKIESMMQGKMKQDFPELYNILLTERNKNWMPEIEQLLTAEQIPMIVVGAGHMTGRQGLLSLLKQQGYDIQQL